MQSGLEVSFIYLLITVTDTANSNVASYKMSSIGFQLACLYSIPARSKCRGQDQCHAHIACKYLVNGSKWINLTIVINITSNIFYRLILFCNRCRQSCVIQCFLLHTSHLSYSVLRLLTDIVDKHILKIVVFIINISVNDFFSLSVLT